MTTDQEQSVAGVEEAARQYLSKIGQRGGKVSSAAKAAAAKRNILKRWRDKKKKGKKQNA